MNIVDHEPHYNSIKFGGRRSPGVVTLSGHEDAVDWDVKAGGAQDGASTTRKGRVPGEFTASHYLVHNEGSGDFEHEEWTEYARFLRSTMDKATAYEIQHPDLVEVGITAAVVRKVAGLKHDGKGGATGVVTFLKYAPAKKVPAKKPTGAKATTGTPAAGPPKPGAPPPKPDPNAARKAVLDDVWNQAKRP